MSGVAMATLIISGCQATPNESAIALPTTTEAQLTPVKDTKTQFIEACEKLGGEYSISEKFSVGQCVAPRRYTSIAIGDTYWESKSSHLDTMLGFVQQIEQKEQELESKKLSLKQKQTEEKPKFIEACSALQGNLSKNQTNCTVEYFNAENLKDLEIYASNIDEWIKQLKTYGYKNSREYVVCNLIGWGEATYRCGTDSGIPKLSYNKKHEPITRIGATVAAAYYDENIAEVKEQNDALANKKAAAEAEAKKIQLTRMWNSRKGNTNPLEFGKSYKCDLVPSGIQSALSSVYGNLLDGAFHIDLGRKTMSFGGASYVAIEEYNGFYLYQRYDETIKVLKKNQIGQGYTNLVKDDVGYYCE
ncbi:hypothetical protein B5X20_RS22855 [Vibrio parahaemolyticus]|nr:hypothetical protein [Vibrio parahaemolyticus]